MTQLMSQHAPQSALTIRNLPDSVAAAIRARAQRDRSSLNKAVVALLEEAVARSPESLPGPPYHDLDDFFGRWTAEQADEFDAALSEERQIDEDDWK